MFFFRAEALRTLGLGVVDHDTSVQDSVGIYTSDSSRRDVDV
jgi:hypothetical protein